MAAQERLLVIFSCCRKFSACSSHSLKLDSGSFVVPGCIHVHMLILQRAVHLPIPPTHLQTPSQDVNLSFR